MIIMSVLDYYSSSPLTQKATQYVLSASREVLPVLVILDVKLFRSTISNDRSNVTLLSDRGVQLFSARSDFFCQRRIPCPNRPLTAIQLSTMLRPPIYIYIYERRKKGSCFEQW